MALTSKKRTGLLWAGVLVLGFAYLFIWPFVVGGQRMQAFCASVPLGTSLTQLQSSVAAEGYRLALGQDGIGLIHDRRAFGRFICQVTLSQNRVVAKHYSFND